MKTSFSLLFVILFLFIENNSFSQGQFFSDRVLGSAPQSDIQPEFQNARNIAISSRIATPGAYCTGFEAVRALNYPYPNDTSYFMIVPNQISVNQYGYAFYKVNDPNNPSLFGKIIINKFPGDIESIVYSDTLTRIFFLDVIPDSSYTKIYSVNLTNTILDSIKNMGSTGLRVWNLYSKDSVVINKLTNIEMIYQFDGNLFLATNHDSLSWYDISSYNQFRYKNKISLIPPVLPTLHELDTTGQNVRLHEVKVYKRTNGNLVIGCPLTRGGMCLVEIFQNGMIANTYQMYEFDRTTFPDTVINPFKAYYDPNNWTGERQHKWDWRICHSVIPYSEGGTDYVLTTDEYTNYPGPRDSSSWKWEALDYYLLNDSEIDTTATPDTIKVTESFAHRLNYRHRNRPRYLGEDPNKFQGAFLRIWDASKLGTNDTTANNRNMILNAYDVQENSSHPEGYVGKYNIPKVSNVPGIGVHEPYIIGNRLYLASYNAGSRILDLHGSNMCVRGYCDTEHPLSNDINSQHWYGRDDSIYMYAKGNYRLVPDKWRPQIIYGSDMYNGLWVERFFDSTITDTIRHISFQPQVEIGTVSNCSRLRFTITKDAIIADSSNVIIVDDTDIKFDSTKKIIVDGVLHIGSVDFDTTNINALSNIVVHKGGKTYIGEDDKTINGFHTMTIDSGGIAYIQGGILNFMRGGIINVYGELQINSVTLNDQSRIVCKPGGKVVICSTATVSGVKRLTIENGGVLEVKSGSTTTLFRGGVIKIQGGVNAALSGNEWAVFDYRFNGADKWEGIVFDSIPRTSTQTRTLSNIIIQHANTGITTYSDATYKSQPTITNCTIAYNDIGITVFNDSPNLTMNRFEHNNVGGLLGYYMSTVVDKNRFTKNTNFGAKLYHCGNLWTSNIIDSNSTGQMGSGYGIFCDELVTVPFNRHGASYSCDTTAGNSLRFNKGGIYLDDLSAVTFECDNSVHGNTNYDIILLDTSSVIGQANYPPAISMVIYNPFPQFTTFKWDSALTTECILLKTNSGTQSPSIAHREPIDIRFTLAMNEAAAFKIERQYSLASSKYKDALQYARARWEVERCFGQWQQLFQDAKINSPSDDPMSYGFIGGEVDYYNALIQRQSEDNPEWLQNTSTEFLGDYFMRSNRYTDALSLYDGLSLKYATEPVIARRALMAKVILKHRGLRDYNGAYNVYEEIERQYPRTKAVIFAKIDLGLPLSNDELDLLKNPVQFEKENQNNDQKQKTAFPHDYALYQCYPNPFNPSTTIKYDLPFSSKVNLKVFNSLGIEVKTIIDKEEPAGLHSVVFDGNSFSSGIYIYRLNVENLESREKKIFEKKMSLLK